MKNREQRNRFICWIVVISILVCISQTKCNAELFLHSDVSAKISDDEDAYIAVYRDILDMFYYKISGGWDETEDVSYLFYWGYSNVHKLSDAGYSLTDLDGNGTPELVVTTVADAKDGMVYDLYTYADKKVIHLASSEERAHYYLCEDNTVYYESSGGATVSSTEMYHISSDGQSLALKELVAYDKGLNPENPWFYSTDAGCYDDYYGFDLSKMTNITYEEAANIMDQYKKVKIELTLFDSYLPQGEMPDDSLLKQAYHSAIGTEKSLHFWYDDFDADGKMEAFGITGISNEWSIQNVKIYFINKTGEVSCLDKIDILYDYDETVLEEQYTILNTGSAKFLTLGGCIGQETFLYGVKGNNAYQPEISGQYASVYQTEGGSFCAEPHEGVPGYYRHFYKYNHVTGEFERIEEPSNPIHHCTPENGDSDTTDWSYVYFGSYPQSEVTGDVLTSAITGASYDENGDAWVNGTKYRRISKSDTNYDEYFGDSTYRYFKWERIKWRVLKNDGSTLFVVADQGIDCKDYNEEYTSITWENCTLRNWLNNDFYSTAFSSSEQEAIVQQNVVNEPNFGNEGGSDTKDNVYLLSIGEVINLDYGFCESKQTNSVGRMMQTSDYAHARGAWKNPYSGYEGNCWWWLRSSGYYTDAAAFVHDGGCVYGLGYYVDNCYNAVVPALHINFSSNLWSSVDDGTSGEGGNGETGSTDIGNAKISCIEKKEVRAGSEEFLFVNIYAEKGEEIDGVVNTTTVTSSDESVLKVEKGCCEKGTQITSEIPAIWLYKLQGIKPGHVDVTFTMKNGTTITCNVTVTSSDGKQPIPVNSEDPSEVAKAVAFSLEDYVSDIQGEDVTIQGPTLNIFDKQFSLFKMNTSTKIGMENLKAEVSYDVEKKLVKVLVGVDTSGKAGIDGTTDNRMCNASWSEEYNQFKNLYKQMTGLEAKKSNRNGTYWNQFEKLKGKMNRFQCNLLVEANMWASGYMEWSYESGELKFSEGGFVEQATLGVESKGNVPNIPLCYWFVGVTADEQGNFIFRRDNTQIVADFSLTPSLTGKIGLGMGKSEGKFQTYLEGSMDAILTATIANQDPKLKVTLNGNLYAKGYAIGHQFLDETYPFPEWQIYPNTDSQALDVAEIGNAEETYQDALKLSRDYLIKEEKVAALGLGDTYFYEQNNVFPYCEPHLFALSNGRLLLLYIGDDGTKSLNNRTSLMYTIYDGNKWSEITSIAEDGTYVDGLSAYQAGDKVYVTYRKADKVFTDDVSLKEMVSSLDLYEITFDGTSFGQPVCINETRNNILESGQVIYAEDGELTVIWMENSENDIFLNDGRNEIYKSTLKNGVWSPKVLITQTEKVVSEINIGSLNGKLTCVYALQNGEKIELYTYDNGNTRQILTEYEQPGEFSLKGERLYFLNKDKLYSYDGSRVQEEGNISGISNFQILDEDGKLVLIANVPGSSGSELYVAEETDGVWSDFRQYTSQGGWIRDYSAVVIDGEVKAAINCLAPDPVEEGNYKDASLIVTGEEEVYDLKADYIYYEDTAVFPGNPLPLEIGMTNQGKNTITQVTVVLKDGNGKKLGDKQVSCNLKPGDSGVTDLEYVLPNTLSQRGLSVELIIPKEEIDTTNNMVSTEIHYIDLAVKNAKCTLTTDNKLLVTGTLANQGLEDISNIHAGIYYSTLTGEKLDEITADTLKTGESIEFTSILPGDMVFLDAKKQLNALMIYAESDAVEQNYINNEARIVYNGAGQINEGNTSDDPNIESGEKPSVEPSIKPSEKPGVEPSIKPSEKPSNKPNITPPSLKPIVSVNMIFVDTNTRAFYKVKKITKKGGEVELLRAKYSANGIYIIPNYVKFKGCKLYVTSVASKALYKNKKITKLLIGEHVSKIGYSAFYGCNNITQVTIKTSSLSKSKVKKNAFKGLNVKVKFKTPKTKLKAYKSLLKARGITSKKAKFYF